MDDLRTGRLLLYDGNHCYSGTAFSGAVALLGLERRALPLAFQRYENVGSARVDMVDGT